MRFYQRKGQIDKIDQTYFYPPNQMYKYPLYITQNDLVNLPTRGNFGDTGHVESWNILKIINEKENEMKKTKIYLTFATTGAPLSPGAWELET